MRSHELQAYLTSVPFFWSLSSNRPCSKRVIRTVNLEPKYYFIYHLRGILQYMTAKLFVANSIGNHDLSFVLFPIFLKQQNVLAEQFASPYRLISILPVLLSALCWPISDEWKRDRTMIHLCSN